MGSPGIGKTLLARAVAGKSFYLSYVASLTICALQAVILFGIPLHLGFFFSKNLGEKILKIHKIGKRKTFSGLEVTPLYGGKNSQIK